LEFHSVPHLPFAAVKARGLQPNSLVVRIQPDEAITLQFGAKVPGQDFIVRSVDMEFCYDEAFAGPRADAYERLIHDALIGDPTLFIRRDEVAQAWTICEPFLQAWKESDVPLGRYRAGTWGPREAARLLERDGRRWRRL
jgi:glucose-6-phosphate 1-dehydrogenase